MPGDEPQTDERCRSIERGAKIVTVMPTTYSVVLQMPRGNLETVYPRALVLAAIRRFIEAERYDEAFLACRNQRVDMNIIHDHDPDRFLTNVEKIVTQINKVEHIDLLLSQLRLVIINLVHRRLLMDIGTRTYQRQCIGRHWKLKTSR